MATPATKFCAVCGDVVKCHNFGVLSCESCKSFFRRQVLHKNFASLRCTGVRERPCFISVAKRSRCRLCRINRCLDIGMGKNFFSPSNCNVYPQVPPTGAQDKNGRTRISKLSAPVFPIVCLGFQEIQDAVAKYYEACAKIPFCHTDLRKIDPEPNYSLKKVIGTMVRRFTVFAGLVSEFSNLPFKDQNILLKAGVLEMCILRGVLGFDPSKKCWYEVPNRCEDAPPVLYLDELGKLTSPPVVYHKHPEFMLSIQNVGVDEPIVMLLVLIVLFSPEREGLNRSCRIEKIQLKYVSLLESYLDRFHSMGDKKKLLLAKLLTKLGDLRELGEYYSNFTIVGTHHPDC